MDDLDAELKKYFGWESFKPGQRLVIEDVLAGKDSIAILPTGGGKSICYQLSALIRKSLVVVISPLVALMENQVQYLRSKGIPAICLHSGLSLSRKKEVNDYFSGIKRDLRLLYLSPERLTKDSVRKYLTKKVVGGEIVAIAVDEAHCISSWGHDFRPDYRRLREIRSLYPSVPLLALSATAPPNVRADIIKLLGLRSPSLHIFSARRQNLFYSIQRRSKYPLPKVIEEINNSRGACLIYVRTRRLVDVWTNNLRNEGIPAISYHAGLDHSVREHALNDFINQSQPVLVGTVAFGMGVDRGDVGLVLHLHLPPNPERYLQEAGRAGRDGSPARCVVLFSPSDRIKLSWAINSAIKNDYEDVNERTLRDNLALEKVKKMEALAEGAQCIEKSLLFEVGELIQPCGQCDNCKKQFIIYDLTKQTLILLRKIQQNSEIDIYKLVKELSPEKNKGDNYWGWLTRRLIQDEFIYESNDGRQKLSIDIIGRNFLQKPWLISYQKAC